MKTNQLNPPTGIVSKRKPLVLIVDDLPENRQVLAGHLHGMGFDIIAAASGEQALQMVGEAAPDLILLDIIMPEMDGFAVCRKLKEMPVTTSIPIIFITARTDTEDVVFGLGLGAVDYVTKPFNLAELSARVRAHLELKFSRDLLLTYNEQLQRLTGHLRRLNDDKNRLLGYVSHDIRGAFGNVISVSEIISQSATPRDEIAHELLNDLGMEAEHMVALAENLLNIDSIERGEFHLKKERVESRMLLDFAMQSHQIGAQAKRLRFTVVGPDLEILGDLTACRQVLTNLVSNAIKYSPENGTITLETHEVSSDRVTLGVRDQGPGIPPEEQRRLFRPFTRENANQGYREHLVGLGLSIVKQMTEAMGGQAGCESVPGQGAWFYFTLPRMPV